MSVPCSNGHRPLVIVSGNATFTVIRGDIDMSRRLVWPAQKWEYLSGGVTGSRAELTELAP